MDKVVEVDGVNTTIVFTGLDTEDYEDVSIDIHMTSTNFDIKATLTYYDQVLIIQ